MADSVLARVAALKTTPTPALKSMWRNLFETEPPQLMLRASPHNTAQPRTTPIFSPGMLREHDSSLN